MKKSICLIGNAEYNDPVAYGQAQKVRLYLKKIIDEGFECRFVNLERIKKRPFTVLRDIKKGIKECDRVVLVSASRGCKYLIPFINFLKGRYHKEFVLPLVGTSVLHFSIDHLGDDEKNSFIINGKYSNAKKSERMAKQLRKIDCILPETDLLSKTFSNFYGLSNVYTLTNFRETQSTFMKKHERKHLNIVYLSRVSKDKGVFDLLNAVIKINSFSSKKIKLDIYGKKEMNENENKMFLELADSHYINYCGPIDNDLVIQTISKYDLFVFPTHFVGEGVPGVIVESLIGGTPVLSALFPQAPYIMSDNHDSAFYNMFDTKDLEQKLLLFLNNPRLLCEFSECALATGKKYLYENNRCIFLKYVCGVDLSENGD